MRRGELDRVHEPTRAGRGHNGGAGIAAACALAERGRRVWVVPMHEAEDYSGVPEEQLEKLAAPEHVRLLRTRTKMRFGGVVDAVVGTGLSGPPRGWTLDVVTMLNNLGSKIVAPGGPVGDLYVADLGLPNALFRDLGLEPLTPPHP